MKDTLAKIIVDNLIILSVILITLFSHFKNYFIVRIIDIVLFVDLLFYIHYYKGDDMEDKSKRYQAIAIGFPFVIYVLIKGGI